MYTVSLKKFVDEFTLECLTPEISLEDKYISKSEVNRPALQLAGYFDYFDNDRIQIIGRVEYTYLERLEPEFRQQILRKIFSLKIPCMVISKNLEPFPEILIFARDNDVPVFRTKAKTSYFMGETILWLQNELAERVTIHGVLVDIYGEGILITGDSGVGKSETALELIKRGHRLVADDAVEIKRVSHKELIGTSPEMIRHFIELRGIGIIDVKELFGVGAVKESQSIDLIIRLEMWDTEKHYDRMGLTEEYTEILGNQVSTSIIPIRPGRNLAVICEAAAINNRLKKLGYNAAQILVQRMEKNIGRN
ncbi:MAG: HPr(Ser) kinase/phosphatase [Clostridiales bacterium]|nr:HPr(Ser) kinase/phosphatase [Clostridiales bacterium]